MTYGFRCPVTGCSSRAFFDFTIPMHNRPRCHRDYSQYVPDVTYPPGTVIEDCTITPTEARTLLANAFESSLSDVDQRTVRSFADLMATGEWQHITIEMGGAHHPILLRGDRVLLGVQRLLACLRADTPFETVRVVLDN